MLFLRFYSFTRLSYILACVLILPLAACSGGSGSEGGGNTLIKWVAPSEREDKTGLSLSQIAGYRIYYGVESGVYTEQVGINDPSATEYAVEDILMPSIKYFVVMTTIDTEGRESNWSRPELEVSF